MDTGISAAGISVELRYLVYSAILLLVVWIPYILAEFSRAGLVGALSYPDERPLPLWAARLRQAHRNLVENFGPFAVAVIAGEFVGLHTSGTVLCAQLFFWARVAHPIAQVVGIFGTRTLTFAIGWGATLTYLFLVLTHVIRVSS